MNLLKESWNRKQFLRQTSSLANVLYISVFTLQPDGESTESLPVLSVWLIGQIRDRSATRQVYKINTSSSCVLFKGDKMGGGWGNKQKKIPQKKNIVHHEILFFLQAVKVNENFKKKKSFFSFFFFFLRLQKQNKRWTIHCTSLLQCAEGVPCEVVVGRLVLEMTKVHLHWRDN